MHLRALAAVAAAALLLVTTACTGGSDTARTDGQPSTIVLGYQQIPTGDLIVKHEKWLEQAFGAGIRVEWRLFASDDAVNAAIRAGSVDIGLVGSIPASRGISTGIRYQVPWIFDTIGDAEALVVVRGGAATVKSLKGKRIATPFGSSSHFNLLTALKDNGLDPKSVRLVNAKPDAILAAWKRGDLDGAYVQNPVLAQLRAAGGRTLVTSAQLADVVESTYDLGVVTDKFAKSYPNAVQTWVAQQDRAVKLIRASPRTAAAALAPGLGVTPAVATAELRHRIFLTGNEQGGNAYLDGHLAKSLYAAAIFNQSLGTLTTVGDQAAYDAAVTSAYARALPGR